MSVAEIAKLAGVSTATVSRVLNNHPSVRPETFLQVRKVLQDIGYRRPLIRRGPKLGRRGGWRTGNIAVMAIGDPNHTRFRIPVFAAALAGIVRAARDHELNVMIDDVPDLDALEPALRDRNIDGALIVVPVMPESAARVRDALDAMSDDVAIVRFMGETIGPTTVDHVGPDNVAVGALAEGYLSSHGRRELAYVTTQPSWDMNRVRAMGFIAAASRARVVPTCYIVSDDPLEESYYGSRVVRCTTSDELTERLICASPQVDGMFFSRDADASLIYPLLVQRGVRVGHDVSVISCDNDDVRLAMLNPRPISIDLFADEIGRRAMLRLVSRIRKPSDPPIRTLIAPRLTVDSEEAQAVEV
jgi:DNA-binding LacI/PurR family transcriptional regulator